MNFEEAYQKTLTKWQRIAAGESSMDPASDCGLCEWARKRRTSVETICSTCPAYYHYGHSCAPLPFMLGADKAFLAGDKPDLLRHFAQQVVEELLSIKTSLFMEAEWIASPKEE